MADGDDRDIGGIGSGTDDPAPADQFTGAFPAVGSMPAADPGRVRRLDAARAARAGRFRRAAVIVASSLLLVVVLVGLFFVGQRLGGDGEPTTAPTPSGNARTLTPTPAPTPSPGPPTGPQPAGVHAWDALFGGECLESYSSPWAEQFTVVDCAAPHTAQLVYRGTFPGDAAAPFPGEAALASQINLLCSAPGAIDLAAAEALGDLQIQGTHPVTEQQWAEGDRSYYCFASRSSGELLTGSVAGPGPAGTPPSGG